MKVFGLNITIACMPSPYPISRFTLRNFRHQHQRAQRNDNHHMNNLSINKTKSGNVCFRQPGRHRFNAISVRHVTLIIHYYFY